MNDFKVIKYSNNNEFFLAVNNINLPENVSFSETVELGKFETYQEAKNFLTKKIEVFYKVKGMLNLLTKQQKKHLGIKNLKKKTKKEKVVSDPKYNDAQTVTSESQKKHVNQTTPFDISFDFSLKELSVDIESEPGRFYIYILWNDKNFYFGCRTSNKTLSEPIDDLNEYQTSSSIIKKIGFAKFQKKILFTSNDKILLFQIEKMLIKTHYTVPGILNRAYTEKGTIQMFKRGKLTNHIKKRGKGRKVCATTDDKITSCVSH